MPAKSPNAKAPLKQGRLRHFSALFFWFWLVALAPAGMQAAAPPTGTSPLSTLRAGFDEGHAIDIQGRVVSYSQEDESLLAEGDVTLESGGSRIHAEKLWYNLKAGALRAEGNVVVEGEGNTLWAEQVAMDQLSKTGEAADLLFYQHPWTAACGGATLLPGDILLLHGCECTSCMQESPHWRLQAKTLKIKAGERMWAYGVLLHAGRVPVFYLPYYSQSLKDPRPPIEIKPGYSKPLGAYVRTSYNYYLDDGQYGSLRYDWMDKKGSGYGAGHHYRMLGGEGDLAGYYTVDKNDPSRQDWSANFRHRQGLGHGLSLLGNVDLLSNYQFNDTYDLSQVDVFQRRSFVSLQSGQNGYSWNLQASETQVLQSVPAIGTAPASREYVVSERQLPGFQYTRYSRPLSEGSPLYWSLDGRLGRRLVVPRVQLTGTAVTVYDSANSYYNLDGSFTPTLSHTLRLTRRLSLNSNINLSEGWLKQEGLDDHGTASTSYGTFFNLNERWNSHFTTGIGHRHQRQITQMERLRWAGELRNQLEAQADLQASEALSLMLSTEYELLPYRVDSDLKRLGLLRGQATYSPDADRNVSLSGGWHAPTGRIKTIDANANLNDRLQLWQLNLGVNWVNNRIVPAIPTLDASAPPELQVEDPRVTPDQFLASGRISLALGPKWHVSYYENLDLTARRLDEQAFSLWRSFGCVDSDIYARETLYGGWQFGFALSLSALPSVKVSSNQVTNDLFQPVQFGY